MLCRIKPSYPPNWHFLVLETAGPSARLVSHHYDKRSTSIWRRSMMARKPMVSVHRCRPLPLFVMRLRGKVSSLYTVLHENISAELPVPVTIGVQKFLLFLYCYPGFDLGSGYQSNGMPKGFRVDRQERIRMFVCYAPNSALI